jgi:hypothetical protein
VSGFLNGAFVGVPGPQRPRSHQRNALNDPPPPTALLERGLAQAHADLAEAARLLTETARETRWGRFTDFTLMQRYRHQQERVRGLTDELSGHRKASA